MERKIPSLEPLTPEQEQTFRLNQLLVECDWIEAFEGTESELRILERVLPDGRRVFLSQSRRVEQPDRIQNVIQVMEPGRTAYHGKNKFAIWDSFGDQIRQRPQTLKPSEILDEINQSPGDEDD